MSAYDRDAWEARWAPPSGLVDVIAARQQALDDTIRTFAARGVPAFVAMWGTSHSRQPLRDRRHLLAHRAVYEAALSRPAGTLRAWPADRRSRSSCTRAGPPARCWTRSGRGRRRTAAAC